MVNKYHPSFPDFSVCVCVDSGRALKTTIRLLCFDFEVALYMYVLEEGKFWQEDN